MLYKNRYNSSLDSNKKTWYGKTLKYISFVVELVLVIVGITSVWFLRIGEKIWYMIKIFYLQSDGVIFRK